MNAARLKRFKKLLEELEAELTGKTPARIEPNRTDEARVGGDEDEQPLNEMMQAIASNRNRTNDVVLGKVRRALKRISEDPDDFGNCQECGDPIVAKRLEKLPYADLCLECQSQKDGPRTGPTRKKVTDYR